jgi:hypothetical protein
MRLCRRKSQVNLRFKYRNCRIATCLLVFTHKSHLCKSEVELHWNSWQNILPLTIATEPTKLTRWTTANRLGAQFTSMWIIRLNWRLYLCYSRASSTSCQSVNRNGWWGSGWSSTAHVSKGIITSHSILFTLPASAKQPNVMARLSKLKLPGACLHGCYGFIF